MTKKTKKQFSAKKEQNGKHHSKLLYLFLLNVGLAFLWGPIFITLTVLGPAKHLSSQVIWVAMISYYANMMTNAATAAALWSSIIANKAHTQSIQNAETLEDHIDGVR